MFYKFGTKNRHHDWLHQPTTALASPALPLVMDGYGDHGITDFSRMFKYRRHRCQLPLKLATWRPSFSVPPAPFFSLFHGCARFRTCSSLRDSSSQLERIVLTYSPHTIIIYRKKCTLLSSSCCSFRLPPLPSL